MGLFGKKKEIVEGAIKDYSVTYLGGHPDYPKKKIGEITLNIMPDCFYLRPTVGSQGWFREFKISYDNVSKFEIAQRTVSTVEGLLGGVNSRQLNQANNIHITYTEGSKEIVLRLEMLTGVTVMGQAQKCNEMMDFLKEQGILDKINKPQSQTAKQNDDIPAQIKKLAELKDQSILTEEEFQSKKAELLAKM